MSPEQHRPPRKGPLPRALVGPVVRKVLPRQRPRTAAQEPASGLVDWALYKNGHRQEAASFGEAYESALHNKNEFLWVGLHQPPEKEFLQIAEQLDLHPLAVEDAIHAHQRPKVDVYGESMFVVLKTVRYVDSREVIESGEIMLFVSNDFVVTVRHGEASGLAQVRRELESRPEVMAAGPTAVLWAVADRAVDGYSDAIVGFAEDVEQIETAVFNASASSPTQRIYKLKREVLEFRRAVGPLADAMGPIVDGSVELVDERTTAYFRDVQDHALRDEGRLAAFDALLSDVLQANLAQVTLRQNEDMRKITAWAAILAVITSIAGIYGMNFEHMPELKWAHGYYICLAVMLAASVGLYISFRRRNWL